MAYKDKADQSAYGKRHYVDNRDEYCERASRRRRELRPQLKAIVDLLKSEPCEDCGVSYPPYVMDFDHVRGEKRREVASMVGRNYSLETVLAEIAKCDLVCSNCHRERTHQRRIAKEA